MIRMLITVLISINLCYLAFAQDTIEGRWHLVGYEDNIMYQFEDNYRYSIYSLDGTFGDIEDAGGSPNPYTVVEDILTIDLFFGTIVNYQMNYICGGQVVEFKHITDGNIHSTLFREGYNYIDNDCEECFDSLLLLTMEDSWGDGWNGNTFCINDECTTLASGSFGTEEFCVNLEIENDMTCGGGSWPEEVLWTLSDSYHNTLATGGAPFEGCVGGSCENEIIESFEFNDNGQIRDYYLYRPNSIQDNAPLVFVLHGLGGSAGGMIGYSDMNAIAAEYGFAVCYPEGTSDQGGTNFWNVGYEIHQNQTVDDVAFLSSLATYLQDEYGFDSQNTFVTGFSNGGDMSYMLACQANDVFRAIAPVAGCMMEEIYNTCDSSPVPVLEIHGTNDNVVWWNGDMQNNDGWGAYYGTEEGIDFWVETNGCMSSENNFLPNTNTSDGSYIINHRYFDCIDNAEVWLYEVVNGGHHWPGSSGNMDIEASDEIWSFFSQFISNVGDVNGDGVLNILDIVAVVNIILGGAPEVPSADFNGDGLINVLDVVEMIGFILQG